MDFRIILQQILGNMFFWKIKPWVSGLNKQTNKKKLEEHSV